MARPQNSDINTTSIDSDFPVAGQDNDSQGFRDNFGTIKTNFVEAKAEIEDLMDNTARLDVDNNFLGNQISGADFINNVETVFPGGTITSGQNVSFENGHVQTFTVAAAMTLTLSDLPSTSGKYQKIRVMILNDGSSRTITWAVSGGGAIKKDSAWPSQDETTVIASDTNYTVIDFFTIDGSTVFAEYKGVYE